MRGDLSAFELHVHETGSLSEEERRGLLELFEANYAEADPAFLEKSLARLRHVAIALRAGVPVGFALGDARVEDLPALPAQVVILGGLSCIAPEVRRRGLFIELSRRAVAAGGVPEAPRRLVCGRMAHPAAMRTISRIESTVPRPGSRPTPWQQQVGAAIARIYGVRDFDPETFVCIGDGRPIGYPVIQFDVEPREWEVFRPVDRDRGDALLAIAWVPRPPTGW